MTLKHTLLSTALALFAGAGILLAGDDHDHGKKKTPATAPTTQEASAAKPSNKLCPVSGDEEVDVEGATSTYQGKTIGFCCDGCKPKFDKNPEKYAKNLK